jgi:hypothetical protein
MDLTSAHTTMTTFCETCVCGRTFSQPGGLHCHRRSCPKAKKQLSGALTKAKEVFGRKKRRLDTSGSQPSISQEIDSAASQIFDSSPLNAEIDVSDLYFNMNRFS